MSEKTADPITGTVSATKVRVIPADLSLQKKIGIGAIDPDKISDAQTALMETAAQHKFEPIATKHIDHLEKAIRFAKDNERAPQEIIDDMQGPIMGIKEHAGFYNYELLGSLASIMLNFLEQLEEFDKDAIEIISAHHKTLNAIVIKQMRGTGGSYGRQLEDELQNACIRYMKRKNA